MALMAFLLLGPLSVVPAAGAELVDRIVAVVNDEVISLYELDQVAGPYIEQVQNSQYPNDVERRLVFEVRQKVLNQLIDQALTDQELERQGISVGEPEIDAAIERVKESRYLTDEQLRRSLEEQGITYEEYREQIKKQILRARLVNREIKSKIVITDEDVRRYYEENKEFYAGQTEYHLRNLYVRLPSFVTESDRRRARETLETIRQELLSGAAFESVVNRYAAGDEGIESSDLGYFKLEDLSRELRELLGDMRAGELTPVLETGFGYQIVYVQEIAQSQGKSLEEASAEIENKLYNEVVDEKYQTWLQSLRERSYIRIIN
jgi:peptidyl-prolyl cis-trans isomerase SurA